MYGANRWYPVAGYSHTGIIRITGAAVAAYCGPSRTTTTTQHGAQQPLANRRPGMGATALSSRQTNKQVWHSPLPTALGTTTQCARSASGKLGGIVVQEITELCSREVQTTTTRNIRTNNAYLACCRHSKTHNTAPTPGAREGRIHNQGMADKHTAIDKTHNRCIKI